MYRFTNKLKRLKSELRKWNRAVFGNVFENAKKAKDHVKAMEAKFDYTGADSDLINLNKAQAELNRSLAEEEDYWRQKARVKWLQEGDRNTKFFHSSVTSKRAVLKISKLKNGEGEWITNQQKLQEAAAAYIQDLLSEDTGKLDEQAVKELIQNIPTKIQDPQNTRLLKPVTKKEVKAAVFHLDPSSAPGSDGFNAKFYQTFGNHC